MSRGYVLELMGGSGSVIGHGMTDNGDGLKYFHLKYPGGVSGVQIRPKAARELAVALLEWAQEVEPTPPNVVQFKQKLDELNDLAVALAAGTKSVA